LRNSKNYIFSITWVLLPIVFIGVLALGCTDVPKRPASRGTLLVISAKSDIENDLIDFLTLRRQQGWEVVLSQPAILSLDGISSLIFEQHQKNPSISHVLLAGSDASLPMGRIPNYRTQYSEQNLPILTDDIYGIPDASGVPTLSVGRLPFDDSATLSRLARKIVSYEERLDSLASEVFLLAGRQLADEKAIMGLFSPQKMVDSMCLGQIEEHRKRLSPMLELHARTAFKGQYFYSFQDSAKTLCEGLARRPMFSFYIGHANREAFCTMQSSNQVYGITRSSVSQVGVAEISGPFILGGCAMLDPEGGDPPIGAMLLDLIGGPVSVVGYTRINDDFCVQQCLEVLSREIRNAGKCTLGELLIRTKQSMVDEPQSSNSKLVQQFMAISGQLVMTDQEISYEKAVAKNNALLTLYGDPTTTISLPQRKQD
jgi:Peptidase family C25